MSRQTNTHVTASTTRKLADHVLSQATDWNDIAEQWFKAADAAALGVTVHCATGLQVAGYPNATAGIPDGYDLFNAGTNGLQTDANGTPLTDARGHYIPNNIDTSWSIYEVLQNHLST
jgi:hypothetical protein